MHTTVGGWECSQHPIWDSYSTLGTGQFPVHVDLGNKSELGQFFLGSHLLCKINQPNLLNGKNKNPFIFPFLREKKSREIVALLLGVTLGELLLCFLPGFKTTTTSLSLSLSSSSFLFSETFVQSAAPKSVIVSHFNQRKKEEGGRGGRHVSQARA